MHQILFQFPFSSGVTARSPPLEALPPDPRGGEGGEGKGRERERGRKGRGKFASLPLGDRRP